jgi:hypothetical protein
MCPEFLQAGTLNVLVMTNTKPKRYRNILRGLGVTATLLYVAFLISETIPEFTGTTVEMVTTLALFVLFVGGFYYLWKDETLSGLMWMAWYAFLWVFVLWVWDVAGMTVIIGAPIFALGILLYLYGRKHRVIHE